MKRIICYTDGGARGNPGPAAIGVYAVDEAGNELFSHKATIGNSTNNFAEYQAVLEALSLVKQKYGNAIATCLVEVRLDSELVKKQLNAEYQIKEPGLVPLFIAIHNLRVASFPNLTLTQVSREQNEAADRLVNEALDGK